MDDDLSKGASLYPNQLSFQIKFINTAAEATSATNEIGFHVISDENNDFARKFGIVFELKEDVRDKHLNYGLPITEMQNEPRTYELPFPATFVIK